MLQFWLDYGKICRIYYAGLTRRCGNYLHLSCADSGRLSSGYVDWLVVFFVLIDILGLCFPWYNLPYGAVIGTAGVLFVEGFSVVENMRKKKSHAADVADMAAKIVECLTPEEAQKLIKKIKEDKK